MSLFPSPLGIPRPLGLAGIALLLAATAVLGAGCARAPERELWVIGLDGADWDMLDPLIARGDMPNLARLRREGAWGRLRSEEPMLSPILWTTIATGRSPDEHGVTWFMTDGPNGEKIPISSRNRTVRTVWNVAHEQGLRSGVVGWWATWPVEPIDGWIVSDYVGWHSFGVTGRELDVPGRVWPTELEPTVMGMLGSPDDIGDELLLSMVDLPPDKLGFDPDRGPFGGPLPHLRQAIATSRAYTDIVLRQLREEQRPDLLALYYEGCDAVMHLFTQYAAPQQPWVEEGDFKAFRRTVDSYWKWQDQLLGEVLAERGPNTTVMIVSDHGFRTGNERLREEEFRVELADASHMPDGIVVLHGPNVKAGARVRGADLYDVAPTMLHLLGLPVAQDLHGEVLTAAFDPDWVASSPISQVASYEGAPWDRGDDLVLDPAAGESMEEMLRSLGYISAGGESDDAGATDRGVIHDAENAVNLSLILRERGKFEQAIAELEKVLESQPDHVEARANLAQTYGEMGDLDAAQRIYNELVAEDPENLEHREDLATAYAMADEIENAMGEYEAGLKLDPAWALGWAGRGFARHQLGRSDEGEADLRRALELDPRLAVAHYYLASVLRSQNELESAVAELRRALELDPLHEKARLELASLLEQNGRSDEALSLLEDAAEMVGESAPLLGERAAIELRRGRWQEAKPLLERSLALDPEQPDMIGNLGMAQAMGGDLEAAALSFERVIELRPESADAHAQLGTLYLQLGRGDKALSNLERGVVLAPENPELRLSLATAHHRMGNLTDARVEYERILDAAPNNALAIYQLGMLTGMEGDQEKALEMIRRARELDPSLPWPGGQ
jgi:tetratricopeptide (TPR) repeat protein